MSTYEVLVHIEATVKVTIEAANVDVAMAGAEDEVSDALNYGLNPPDYGDNVLSMDITTSSTEVTGIREVS